MTCLKMDISKVEGGKPSLSPSASILPSARASFPWWVYDGDPVPIGVVWIVDGVSRGGTGLEERTESTREVFSAKLSA